MTPLLLSNIVFALLIALWWAASDAKTIKGRILSGDDPDLDHSELAAWRFVALVVGLGGTFLWLKWTGASMWLLIPGATVAWSVFGIVHVFRLNTLRKMSLWYVSSSNAYDRFWLRVSEWVRTDGHCWLRSTDIMDGAMRGYHNPEAILREQLIDWVHKAGQLSFYFRLLVLSLSVVCWIVVNLK